MKQTLEQAIEKCQESGGFKRCWLNEYNRPHCEYMSHVHNEATTDASGLPTVQKYYLCLYKQERRRRKANE